MSCTISGTTINLTRGDTFRAIVTPILPDTDNEPYIPVEGDSIRFALKQKYEDVVPILVKDIPIDTLELVLRPEDTKEMPYGKYVYDIQLTYANGDIDTFIAKAKFNLTEEVY